MADLKAGRGPSETEDVPAGLIPSADGSFTMKAEILARLLFPVDFLVFTLPLVSSSLCLHQCF